MQVFWDAIPSQLASGGALFLHLQGQAVKEDLLLDPEDGNTMLLRNVNNYFPIDMALHSWILNSAAENFMNKRATNIMVSASSLLHVPVGL